MKNRTIIGILCIVLAVAVMFGITPLVNTVASGKTGVIQVVKRIEPGQRITAEDITKVQIGSFGIKDTAIKDEKQIVGKYAAVTIMPDNCVYPDMVTDDSNSADHIFRQLNGAQQVISITIPSFANGLSGKLKNGDIVSVVVVSATESGAENESTIPAELTYVRVITTTTAKGTDSDELTANEDGTTDLPATATLLVTPVQAKLLALHDRKSHMYLTLVYRGDAEIAQKFLDAQSAVLAKAGDGNE